MLKSQVPEESLVQIRFLKSDLATGRTGLRWEHAGEFGLNGNMYDIVRIAWEGKYIVFHCFNDSKETSLLKGRDALLHDFASKDKDSNRKAEVLQRLLTLTLFQIQDEDVILNTAFRYLKSGFIKIFKEIVRDIPTPPPWNRPDLIKMKIN